MQTAARIDAIRAAFPREGLFRDKDWVLSPEPFPLDAGTVELIQSLGPALRAFQEACNRLYQVSAAGEDHPWVAELLDRGKPRRVVELGGHPAWRDALPRVIRPDLVLTENGVCISEIDSLPGGIGLTAWLNQSYARLGDAVIGGEFGMIEGFAAAFPDEDVLISRESADYLPEMKWLLEAIHQHSGAPARRVIETAVWRAASSGKRYYRFFELFDLANVEHADELLRLAVEDGIQFTPPLKAYLEEKLWLALFWVPQLEDYWSGALSPAHLALLRQCIPHGWVLDPAPLPPTAVYPDLEIQSWQELKQFGRKQRELVLKISGFSERGWGSRGVFIGHDLSHDDWGRALDGALEGAEVNPHVLQRFLAGKVVNHPAWQDERKATQPMKARARLCPYYFAAGGEIRLSGVLATVCPADKKILHGMRDAMMLPCVAE